MLQKIGNIALEHISKVDIPGTMCFIRKLEGQSARMR